MESSGVSGADATAIVLTRNRPQLLRRALGSLAAQLGVQLDVLVVVDDCPDSAGVLEEHRPGGSIRSLRWQYASRADGERGGPGRVARLRSMALELTGTEWCTFLDDDNEAEPDHCASLLSCARETGASAVHSWRTLWTRDGSPYVLRGRHPWCRDRTVSEEMYERYAAAGIYAAGSATVRDQVVPYCRDQSMVDTSEWLFRSSLLRELGFRTEYTREDWELSRAEDNKLLDDVVAAGLTVPTTRSATLRYYLGGYSNNPRNEAADLGAWLPVANGRTSSDEPEGLATARTVKVRGN